MVGLYTKIFDQARKTGFKKGTMEARDWFREKAMAIARKNTNVNRLIEKSGADHVSHVEIGHMYYFLYDPKHKVTLPYYDKFPLIFPIESYDDGFLGINMHYLPPFFRARLMDALYTTRTDNKFDKKTKLKISYNILKSATKFKYFKPCVKRYLSKHVRSNFIKVPSEQWDFALMLPVDRFAKQSRNKVWDDSKKMILG